MNEYSKEVNKYFTVAGLQLCHFFHAYAASHDISKASTALLTLMFHLLIRRWSKAKPPEYIPYMEDKIYFDFKISGKSLMK